VVVILVGEVIKLFNKEKTAYSNVEDARPTRILMCHLDSNSVLLRLA
jgi:hypothetical protein